MRHDSGCRFCLSRDHPGKLEQWYQDNAERLAIDFSFLPLEGHQGRRQTAKELYVVTILARDRPGIIRDVAEVATRYEINIERASVTARGVDLH